jgi:hypothetical protein
MRLGEDENASGILLAHAGHIYVQGTLEFFKGNGPELPRSRNPARKPFCDSSS